MGKIQRTKSCLRKQNQPNCQLGHIILLLIANLGIIEIFCRRPSLYLHCRFPRFSPPRALLISRHTMAVPECIGVPVSHIIMRVGSPRVYRCAGFPFIPRPDHGGKHSSAGSPLDPGRHSSDIGRIDRNLRFQPRELVLGNVPRMMERRSDRNHMFRPRVLGARTMK